MFARFLSLLFIAAVVTFQFSFSKDLQPTKKKIAVLLVNHGSRSATWRNALLELEKEVTPILKKNTSIREVKTAFMEYTEPSIATRLKELDNAGYTDIVIVPVFLTVSSHTFDDIPTIAGQKEDPQSVASLKLEKIERYTPKANIVIAPNLDFTDILQKNILKRVTQLSKNPNEEGLVMIAYGDVTYNEEWCALLDKVGKYVQKNLALPTYSYGWCGHIVHYDPEKTTEAISKVVTQNKTALVVPVLVAHDEMFQIKIIGDGIAKIKESKKWVRYKPDSILPDENVSTWVITIANELVSKILSQEMSLNK